MPAKRTTTTARKPRSQPKAVAQEVAVVEQTEEFSIGQLVLIGNGYSGACSAFFRGKTGKIESFSEGGLVKVAVAGCAPSTVRCAMVSRTDLDCAQLTKASDLTTKGKSTVDLPELEEVAVTVEVLPSDPQTERLATLEAQIQHGIDQIESGRSAIWQAVAEVQQQGLWRLGGHRSFEAYCKERWGWEKSNAFEVSSAGRIVAELKNSGVPESALPTSVAQARQIAKLPQEKRAEVVLKIAESGEKLTAEAIKQAACTHSFGEVAALYATLPETEFLKHKNGSFNYAVNSCGYAKVYRSPDEAFEMFEWHKGRVERYLRQDEPTCDRCQHCEVSNNAWYCQKHKQEYTPDENPALTCATYAPIEYGLKPKPKAAPTLDPPPQTAAGVKFQRGDRVRIIADDDLNGYAAIVDHTFEAESQAWATIYCSELPGVALDYRVDELQLINLAHGSGDTDWELEQIRQPPVELTPQPTISPEQRVAEKLLAEYKVSILDVAKKLVGWLPDDGLEKISDWMLDEKARRKGFADYEEFAESVQAKFFEKEAS